MAIPETHRLIQLTDFHLGSSPELRFRGVNTSKTLAGVLAHIAAQTIQPDRFLLTGDLAEEPSVLTYQLIGTAFKEFTSPIHFLPGNHDHLPTMRESLTGIGFSGEKIIGWKNWHILLLDSSQNGNPQGNLGPEELQWLDATLKALPESWILIALHHHPIPSDSEWMDTMMIRDSEPFMDLISSHGGVKGVLFGHVHQEVDQFRGDIRYLGTPSTCFQFARWHRTFSTDDSAPGYRWVELYDDGRWETQVVRLEAEN